MNHFHCNCSNNYINETLLIADFIGKVAVREDVKKRQNGGKVKFLQDGNDGAEGNTCNLNCFMNFLTYFQKKKFFLFILKYI